VTKQSPLSTENRQERLIGIQACRGIAALLVILYHSGRMLALPQYAGHVPTGSVFAFGHAGVDFFFVLSGFIISLVHGHDLGVAERFPGYVWRRLSRIYPMYWVVTGLIIALALFSADQATRLAPNHVAASVLLIPHGQEPLLGVAWTLEHEMLFYGLFGIAILRKQLIRPLLVSLFVLVATEQLFHFGGILGWLGNIYHLNFLIGIAAALILRDCRIGAPHLIALLGVTVFLCSGAAEDLALLHPAGLTATLLFGLASATILIGLAEAERRELLHFGLVASLFGAASYSIYLIHPVAIGLTARFLVGTGAMPFLTDWILLVLVSAVAVAAGIGLHIAVERPVMIALGRIRPGRRGLVRVP